MTATLLNTDGTQRIVFDGEIVVGEGLAFGPLPGGRAWLDARAGSGEGIGGYPAAYYQALENATGLLGVEHIEPGGEHGVLYVSGGLTTWGLIMDANVSSVAAIDASKITGDAELGSLVLSSFLEVGTGIDAGGTIAAGGNLLAGGYLGAGTNGVSFADLLDGHAPLFSIPGTSLVCTNLDADKLDGEHGSYYLALGNAFGILATANGGTGADGSALAASRFLVSPTGGGAAAYRAMDPADIPVHTSALVSDFVSAARSSISILDGTNIDLSYNSATGVISASITGQVGLANGGTGVDGTSQTANRVLASPSSGSPGDLTVRALVANDIPSLLAVKISDLTESVQDIVGAFATDGTNIDVVYDDTANTLTFNITGTLARANLPSAIAYEDEANIYTGMQTINRSAAALRINSNAATDARVEFQYNSTGIGDINIASATHLSIRTASSVNLSLAPGSGGNIGLGAVPSAGGGAKVVFILNATTLPTSNPTGGGILYCDAGALKYRGSGGTVTTLGAA